jgi:hypothetical protein
MRRTKRLTIMRVALALTVTAIFPVAAQAKPMPSDSNSSDSSQIPYLSQGQGVDSSEFGQVGVSPDDRNFSRALTGQHVVIPYMSQGHGVTSSELGFAGSNGSDDRAFSRAPILESTPVVSDDGGSTIDINPYAVTGFGIALLLALGMGVAIWQSRRTRLSPA